MSRCKGFLSSYSLLPPSALQAGHGECSHLPSTRTRWWTKERTNKKEFWIYGRHATLAALANPERRCRRLLVTADMAKIVANVIANTQAGEWALPPLEVVDRSVIEAIVPERVHQGIIVQIAPLIPLPIETVVARAAECTEAVVVVLDQVTDPHNVGAVVRSAAAFGALAVVMQEHHAPAETGTLARVASGGLERVALTRVVNLARTLETLKTAGFWVVGLEADAPFVLSQTQISGRIALVLGSEGHGLRRLVRAHCDILLCLPMTGAVESLNVSNAATVALYEITRLRLIDPASAGT